MRAFKHLFGRYSDALPLSVRSIGISVLASLLLVGAVEQMGLLQRVELDIYDALIRASEDRPPDERLLLVGINEADLARFGNPVNDATLASAIAELRRQGARVIGLGLYRNIAYPPGTDALRAHFEAPELVAIRYVGVDPDVGEVPSPPGVPAGQIGFNDLVVDADGVIRRALLFVGNEDFAFYSFALRCALVALPEDAQTFRFDKGSLFLNGHAIPRLGPHAGGYVDADTSGYQSMLRFRSRRLPAPMVSLSELVDGSLRADQVQDKVVLIGGVGASLNSNFLIPHSAGLREDFAMPGVVVHAQIVSQLLDTAQGVQTQYRYLPRWAEIVWVMGWSLLAALLAWVLRDPLWILLTLPVAPAASLLLGWAALWQLLWLPMFAPALAALSAAGLVMAEKYRRRVTHNTVTGLPRRSAFLRRLAAALDPAGLKPVCVVFLNIDRFQIVNKSLGHRAGDQLLRQVAQRLRRCIGEEGELAHLGGDEFMVLLKGLSATAIRARIEDMRQTIGAPLSFAELRLSISTSVGAAMALEGANPTPEDLLRDAQTAMYRAKQNKSIQFEVFTADMREQANSRLELESELLCALERGEFFLVYQPFVELQTGKLAGFEALVRWHSPRRGLVSPVEFIPVAEETGLIVPLGQWILQTACAQARNWSSSFPGSFVKLNVNLSPRQLDDPELETVISDTLKGLRPGCLQLELTESMLMRDMDTTHQLMLRLKDVGVGLAIDDFGTGHSSLSYLHRFPADTLKIDRCFVEHITSSNEERAIVNTIIALGQRLDMQLVAEGVETAAQAQLLRDAGCELAQGFYFSVPLTVEQASAMLAESASGALQVRVKASLTARPDLRQ